MDGESLPVKIGLRDLLWLMIVAALLMVIFTNMFAYRAKHRELMNRLQATQELEAALVETLNQFQSTSTTDKQPDFDQSPKQQLPRKTK